MTEKTPTRIYAVKSAAGDTLALIRAANRVQALNHFARKTLVATLPSQDELLEAAGNGHKVEAAVELEAA